MNIKRARVVGSALGWNVGGCTYSLEPYGEGAKSRERDFLEAPKKSASRSDRACWTE
jgi:hypothetical protein